MLFRKWGCLVGPENSIFRKLKSVDPKKEPFTTEMLLHFYFPFKAFPENERERERARASAREEKIQFAIASSSSSPRSRSSRDRAVDRDLAFARSRRRSRSHEEGEIAIAPWSWSRRGLCFLICVFRFVFSFFFSKHQKIFSGKFFGMQPNTWKHFPFPKISISGKYVFFGKHFTATKHSLRTEYDMKIMCGSSDVDH